MYKRQLEAEVTKDLYLSKTPPSSSLTGQTEGSPWVFTYYFNTDKLIDDDFGISYEEFEDTLKSLEESKRILVYRAARGIDEEYLGRGLLSLIRISIVNTQVDDSEVDARVLSDEEKVIEKLVIGDKLFKPTQSQQTFTRPSRSVETSFEGIFWAFALLAFAVAIMFLINNAS